MDSMVDRRPASYMNKKWGVFSEFFADGTASLFSIPYLLGSPFGYGFDTDEGTYTDYQTASAVNSHAGYTGSIVMTKTSFNPIFRFKFKLDSVADCRLWFGFSSAAGTTTYPSGDDAFNGISGFALSMRANETNWQIAHNDGTGATVFDDVDDGSVPGSVTPIPVDTNVHTVQLAYNSGLSPLGTFDIIWDNAVIAQYFDTEIPLTTDSLTITMCIENSVAASQKVIRIYWLEVQSDK